MNQCFTAAPNMYDHTRTFILSTMPVLAFSVIFFTHKSPVLMTNGIVALVLMLLNLALLIGLRRSAKSENLASWVFLLAICELITMICFNHEHYIRDHFPYEVFIGIKVLSVFVPMANPPKRWVGTTTLVLLAIIPIVQFFSWPEELQRSLSVQEPWLTAAMAISCLTIYSFRLDLDEQRRCALIREANLAAFERLSLLLLAARHLLNSKLQTIEIICQLMRSENRISDVMAENLKRSFVTIRRINEILSFAETRLSRDSMRLPSNTDELEGQVRDLLFKFGVT